jgi:hypothetical protein
LVGKCLGRDMSEVGRCLVGKCLVGKRLVGECPGIILYTVTAYAYTDCYINPHLCVHSSYWLLRQTSAANRSRVECTDSECGL